MAEFLKVMNEQDRMCRSVDCFDCLIGIKATTLRMECKEFIVDYPNEAERIIMQWAAEHPLKTNGMKFREVFGQPYEHLFEANEFIKQWLSQEYKG